MTTPEGPSPPLLDVAALRVHFPIRRGLLQRSVGTIRAVDGISFSIEPGETYALVGESGCGKSTTGYAVLRMIRPSSGRVVFDGQDLTQLEGEALRRLQGEMQIVFQDPYSSLDPKLTVGESVGEPLLVRHVLKGEALRARVGELLALVGLRREHAGRYPHEFSGGQRQRIGIADGARRFEQYPFELSGGMCQRVMIAIALICHDLFRGPAHPYTKALLSAIPVPDPIAQRARQPIVLQGDLPSPAAPPSGCPFRTRCPIAEGICATDPPALRPLAEGHRVACHFAP